MKHVVCMNFTMKGKIMAIEATTKATTPITTATAAPATASTTAQVATPKQAATAPASVINPTAVAPKKEETAGVIGTAPGKPAPAPELAKKLDVMA